MFYLDSNREPTKALSWRIDPISFAPLKDHPCCFEGDKEGFRNESDTDDDS